jgi:hypothetical protein
MRTGFRLIVVVTLYRGVLTSLPSDLRFTARVPDGSGVEIVAGKIGRCPLSRTSGGGHWPHP